jgi:23S rRNA (uracil1939-C5)-methyltransferase
VSSARAPASVARAVAETEVGALAHDGRGVAKVEGKATFIRGALPGERVRYRVRHRRRGMDEADLLAVLSPAADRVTPPCPHFGSCGGCVLQHLAPAAQVAAKQAGLLGDLRRIARLTPARVLEPVTGPVSGYRRRARLGVHRDRDSGVVRIGFRGEDTHIIQALQGCEVLDPRLGVLIAPLATLLGTLSIPHRIPQLEVATGEASVVIVVRHLEPLSASDLDALRGFGAQHGVELWTQSGGPATAVPLAPAARLHYSLPAHGVELDFLPTDFVQVNAAVNALMIDQALDLLALDGSQRVLDLFAGLGNFTLPLARRAASVVGVEGEAALVARARANATANGITNTEFHCSDLFDVRPGAPWMRGTYDAVLLDPPRAGAREVLPALAQLGARRIVYVSCHPGTLARDAGLLVAEHGYRLSAAGVCDMFPHTAHVESMALFER